MADVLNSGKELLNDAARVAGNISSITKATAKTSLVRLTGDQVFQFPLIMDADIDDDEKFPIIKSIEKNYASLVMMAIVNHGFVDRDKYGSINKFLGQFHNNGDLPFNSRGFESYLYGGTQPTSLEVVEATAFEGTGFVNHKDLIKMWDCVEEQLDTSSINEMYQPYRYTKAKLERAHRLAIATEADQGNTRYFRIPYAMRDRDGKNVFKNAGNPIIDVDNKGNPKWSYIEVPNDANLVQQYTQQYGAPRTVAEWRVENRSEDTADYQARKDIDYTTSDRLNRESDERKGQQWENQFNRQQQARQDETKAKNEFEQKEYDRRHQQERMERIADQMNRNKFEQDEYNRRHKIEREERLADQAHKDRIDAFKNISGSMVRDDKYNSLTPTILQMTLANGKKDIGSWSQQLIIGVRAMPRMLPQSLMVANMTEAVKDRPIFKFIKWLKGEISWADLFTGIGNAKKEVTGNAKWLNVLRKRARRAKLRWLGFKLNPNCTIIITEADAHLILERTGIDLHRTGEVQKLMDKYFLLGFGIYDTEAKMLNILYDGDSEFSHNSLRTMIADSKREANLLAMGRY